MQSVHAVWYCRNESQKHQDTDECNKKSHQPILLVPLLRTCVGQVQHGGGTTEIDQLHAVCRPLIERYHGRLDLMEYMRQQVVAVAVDGSCDEVSTLPWETISVGISSLPVVSSAVFRTEVSTWVTDIARSTVLVLIH